MNLYINKSSINLAPLIMRRRVRYNNREDTRNMDQSMKTDSQAPIANRDPVIESYKKDIDRSA